MGSRSEKIVAERAQVENGRPLCARACQPAGRPAGRQMLGDYPNTRQWTSHFAQIDFHAHSLKLKLKLFPVACMLMAHLLPSANGTGPPVIVAPQDERQRRLDFSIPRLSLPLSLFYFILISLGSSSFFLLLPLTLMQDHSSGRLHSDRNFRSRSRPNTHDRTAGWPTSGWRPFEHSPDRRPL